MAHVQKRNGRWQARYRDPAGKEHAKRFARKVDAEKWLATTQADQLRGTYIDPAAGKVTFRAYAEEWRRIQLHRPGTAQSVEQQLRLHVYPHIGGRPVAAVRPSDVQALVHRLDSTLSASTTEVVYGRVVAVFRAAVRDRLIPASPCLDVRLPSKRPASMLEVLSAEQVHTLAAAVPSRYRAWCWLAPVRVSGRGSSSASLSTGSTSSGGPYVSISSSPGFVAEGSSWHLPRRQRPTARSHSRRSWPPPWPPTSRSGRLRLSWA